MSRRRSWQQRRRAVLSALIAVCVVALVGGLYKLAKPHPVAAAGQTPGYTASPIPTSEPVVAFLGDSYTGGSAMDSGVEANRWPSLVSQKLGWRPAMFGVGGSGFVNPGQGKPFIDRVSAVVASKPAIVVIEGGHNDVGFPLTQVAAAAKTLIDTIRADLPNAKLVVVAPILATDASFPTADAIEQDLKSDAAAVGATFIDPIADDWLRGRAKTIIGSDGTHPNDAGEVALESYFEPKLAAVWR